MNDWSLFLIFESFLRGAAVLLQQLNGMWLIALLSELNRSHAILICVGQFGSVLKEELHHIEPVGLDSVVEGRLAIVIDEVQVASITHELLYGLQVALSRGIEDGRLAVGVYIIHVAIALGDKKVYELILALSRGVVESCLIEGVGLLWLDPELLENTGCPRGKVVALDQARGKHWSLLVVGLID